MLTGQGMALVAVGLALGVAAARGLTRVISMLLYGVSELIRCFCGRARVAGRGWITGEYRAARRATRLDPLACLRSE
jgi:hypothetical protein